MSAAAGIAKSRRPGRGGRRLQLAILLLGIAWAIGATWFAVSNHFAVIRLGEEQAALRIAHEDKVRALIRRLVGVASHQVLEQDGLAGRLADIIARQVELENRQASLGLMADRIAGEEPQAVVPSASPSPRPVDPPADAARGRPSPEAPVRERRSSLDDRASARRG